MVCAFRNKRLMFLIVSWKTNLPNHSGHRIATKLNKQINYPCFMYGLRQEVLFDTLPCILANVRSASNPANQTFHIPKVQEKHCYTALAITN